MTHYTFAPCAKSRWLTPSCQVKDGKSVASLVSVHILSDRAGLVGPVPVYLRHGTSVC